MSRKFVSLVVGTGTNPIHALLYLIFIKRGSTISKIIGYNVQPLAYLVDPDVRLWVHEEIVDGRKLSEIINQDHENIK